MVRLLLATDHKGTSKYQLSNAKQYAQIHHTCRFITESWKKEIGTGPAYIKMQIGQKKKRKHASMVSLPDQLENPQQSSQLS
jgi:hypothetical protein